MSTEIKTMRDVFIEKIYDRMCTDENIFFLSADFGAPKLDILREQFKDRFVNVGISEQNLINLSLGLALEGFIVYAYAIAPFLTMRAYEQIRINLALHSQLKEINVNLIGVGAGISYDVSGPTHHCPEDITIIRNLPNIWLFSPSDWFLAESFFDYSRKIQKPKYLRFDGKPLPRIYESLSESDLTMGFKILKEGEYLCLVSTGYMTHKALRIANLMEKENIHVGVIDIFLLKPFSENLFFNLIKKYDCVITLEEAFINKGGLDSLVSCILNDNNSNMKMRKMGVEDRYIFESGSREYLHKMNKMDEDSIIRNIKEMLK
jgi:transketolase